jgi:LCP family protein required for cell wall assembly
MVDHYPSGTAAGGHASPPRYDGQTGPPAHPDSPPPKPVQRRRRRRGRVATVMMFAALGLVLLMVLGAIWGIRRYRQFDFVDIAGVDPPASGPTNWLLVGLDSREGLEASDPNSGAFLGPDVIPGARTDTIMVARVDTSTSGVELLSVPRDLWVPIAGKGENGRINGAFNGPGGRERLVATVESALQINIHHYAEVNFIGFQEIVEALGGVPLWFEAPMRDAATGLNVVDSGCHVLNGPQALAFARSRKVENMVDGQWQDDGTGDLGRTARQRYFLTQVARVAADRISPIGVFSIDRLVAASAENMVIEDGAGLGDVATLARTFARGGDVTTHNLPVSDMVTSGGAQVLELREGEAQATLELFRTPGEAPPNPTLSGDQTVPELKISESRSLLPGDMASSALPGVTEEQCPTAVG